MSVIRSVLADPSPRARGKLYDAECDERSADKALGVKKHAQHGINRTLEVPLRTSTAYCIPHILSGYVEDIRASSYGHKNEVQEFSLVPAKLFYLVPPLLNTLEPTQCNIRF